jgi:ZIP family zinc transporter
MTFGHTVLLGAIASLTIFIGLPLGRIKSMSKLTRIALAMFSVGVLCFLFVDVGSHMFSTLEVAVSSLRAGKSGLGHVALYVLLSATGFLMGSAGLAWLDSRMRVTPANLAPIAGGAPGATLARSEEQLLIEQAEQARKARLRTGLMIASAIGIHNLGEGLAIGVSARTGALSLATVLVIGFALHNATEGFGIVGPLGNANPSWRWLGAAGLIAGSPVLIGTIIGWNVTAEPLELACFALAGGAILYVIGEIWHAMARMGHREFGLLMLGAGFFVGVVTDLVVAYGGG